MPKTLGPFLPKPDDPDIVKRVTDATLLGHPIQTAGRMAGLGHTTAWEWLRKGTALLVEHPEVDPAELGSHAVFADAVEKARAEMVDKQLRRIDMAAKEPKNWPAAMTLLERRLPDDFGRNQRIEFNRTETVTHRLELGTAEAAILVRIAELEAENAPLLTEGGGPGADAAIPPAD